jgi:hypothetical protein
MDEKVEMSIRAQMYKESAHTSHQRGPSRSAVRRLVPYRSGFRGQNRNRLQ